MIKIETARQTLPEDTREMFDDIVTQRVLGASNHINMIGKMIESIALEGEKNHLPATRIVDDILQISQFFIETRGEASQAVSNAINIMTKNIHHVRNLDTKEAVNRIIQTKGSYLKNAKAALELVVDYGVKLAKSMKKIMVFDYSSTVDKLLEKLEGVNEGLTVVIPESRSIDGGHAFVKTCHKAGHHVQFIPDAAIMYFLKECDAAFIGAETFFPNGTVFNTTGSDIVGLVCKEFNIPLYVLTPLIKVDIRSIYGFEKELVVNDLKDRLAANWGQEEQEMTDFKCPELLGVEPKYITAVISERGIIPAGQLFNVSVKYYEELKGGA